MSPTKTPPTTASRPRMGPSSASCPSANSAAAGVFLSDGGITRYTSHGTNTLAASPGRRPAVNQLAQVMVTPAYSAASSPSRRLAALL